MKIFDVQCRPHCTGCSAEEHASGNLLVFPRNGVFVRHSLRHRDDVIADSTSALFFNKNEPYRVSHPITGGDDCTAIAFEDEALVKWSMRDRPAHKPFLIAAVAAPRAATIALLQLRQYLRQATMIDSLVVEESCLRLLASCLAVAPIPSKIRRRQSTPACAP